MRKVKVFKTFVMGQYSFKANEIYELPDVMVNGLLTMKIAEEVFEKEEKPKKKKTKKDTE